MRKNLNLDAIRERLAGTQGPTYWRTLEELAETDEFEAMVQREFPQGVSEWTNPVSRRNFLRLMGASLALGGLTGCSISEPEKIVPYVEAPEEYILAGEPLFYATSFLRNGIATGVLAENQMGRPIKIEGNPQHPASLGSTDVWAQASILDLYDPDRSRTVLNAGVISTWDNFLAALSPQIDIQRVKNGSGLRILSESITSPTMQAQLATILEQFPEAKWHQYEVGGRDNVYAGTEIAFGEALNPVYHLDQADVILSLDADFMGTMAGSVRYARDFAARRKVHDQNPNLNRLYTIESSPTPSGVLADHKIPLRPGLMESVVRMAANEIGLDVPPPNTGALDPETQSWVQAMAADLLAHRGRSLVMVGEHLPPMVHAIAHAINNFLSNVTVTVTYTEPLEGTVVNKVESLNELVADMNAGVVDMLVILEANPVYTAPVDVDFVNAMAQVNFRVHMGLHRDETGTLCNWHIPATHYLEMWGDARAYDGTLNVIQPLIQPLYDSKAPNELLAALLGQPAASYDIVRAHWEASNSATDFETFWHTAIHDGFVPDSALPHKLVSVQDSISVFSAVDSSLLSDEMEVLFRPDPSVLDGRYANNGWLQELPKPVTKLTWDNAVLISVETAERFDLQSGDMVDLRVGRQQLQVPVWVQPGHADNAVTVFLGYGRLQTGRVGDGLGFNTYQLRTASAPEFARGGRLVKTGEKYDLASTQTHYQMEGRALVRAGTIEQYREDPEFVAHMVHLPPDISLFEGEWSYDSYAWGMSVDLGSCTGCNACVIACQAENNIPIVGKTEVLLGREMHWMRIDSYYEGDPDNPKQYNQPMMCQHCEQAPCEIVCPVAATVHDSEGLNVMVYNRCVGTRYCSNNCPYKVRRFNFLQYSDDNTESLKLQRNPEVTVRVRGVMEKCSYCIQRISTARIKANNDGGRRIQDGEVVTACQGACPTQAISFGDINDPESHISQERNSSLSYALLSELGTRPRTTYKARIRNPNLELEPHQASEKH